mmetsp:Transcript_9852/g.28937  ORF Transcript_9852/g.28937 Transcript_9852/m.28937 type:complete len:454 (+) Transcript_9852:1900-3261(+)
MVLQLGHGGADRRRRAYLGHFGQEDPRRVRGRHRPCGLPRARARGGARLPGHAPEDRELLAHQHGGVHRRGRHGGRQRDHGGDLAHHLRVQGRGEGLGAAGAARSARVPAGADHARVLREPRQQGAQRVPRQRGHQGAALALRDQQLQDHGERRVQGLQHQHLPDHRLRRPAERGGQAHPLRLPQPHAAPLHQGRLRPRVPGLRGELVPPRAHAPGVLLPRHGRARGPHRHGGQDLGDGLHPAAPRQGHGGRHGQVRRHGAQGHGLHPPVPLRRGRHGRRHPREPGVQVPRHVQRRVPPVLCVGPKPPGPLRGVARAQDPRGVPPQPGGAVQAPGGVPHPRARPGHPPLLRLPRAARARGPHARLAHAREHRAAAAERQAALRGGHAAAVRAPPRHHRGPHPGPPRPPRGGARRRPHLRHGAAQRDDQLLRPRARDAALQGAAARPPPQPQGL